MLILALCEREARINVALDPAVIHGVFIRLGRYTRIKPGEVGPLSGSEINRAFAEVTGFAPVDESVVMLQRLALLGRVGLESTDRQFVDTYFLDGLRAEDVTRAVIAQETSVAAEAWRNPLRALGVSLLVREMELSPDVSGFVQLMRRAAEGRNSVLAGDILASIVSAHDGNFDFSGMRLRDSHIAWLDLSESTISNLTIEETIIERLDITEAHPTNVAINKCEIGSVEGVSGEKGLPGWITASRVEIFRSVSNVARIRNAPLSPEERVFVTIIKKTFFQPGGGRKEEALVRGLGNKVDKRVIKRIINMLIDQDILTPVKGKEGRVFVPNRKHVKRMNEILTRLTLSDDPLWKSLRRR